MRWSPGQVFALIFVTNLLTNFDSGALPGVLNHLRATPQYAPAIDADASGSRPERDRRQPAPAPAPADDGSTHKHSSRHEGRGDEENDDEGSDQEAPPDEGPGGDGGAADAAATDAEPDDGGGADDGEGGPKHRGHDGDKDADEVSDAGKADRDAGDGAADADGAGDEADGSGQGPSRRERQRAKKDKKREDKDARQNRQRGDGEEGGRRRLAEEPPADSDRRPWPHPGDCVGHCDGFSLTYLQCGVLGSLPYIALSLVSPFVGAFLQRADVRRVLLLAVVLNGLASAAFGLAQTVWQLMLARFMVGVTQAFAVIYFPVWVDSKAEPSAKTWQMSLMQVGVPLGIVLGYLLGGLITEAVDTSDWPVAGWRLPFLVQGGVLVPLGLAIGLVPARMLEVDADAVPLASPGRARSDEADGARAARLDLTLCDMVAILLRSKVYIYVLLCLSTIFFIVSGIQYWVTIFLLEYFHMEARTVVLLFALVSSTGPLIGVLAGGWLVDRLGGYEDHPRCLRVLAHYTVVGVGLALGIALSDSGEVVVALIWCLLVVGGAVLAPATGILITAVPLPVRTFASAISMMSYNVLGYFLAPLASGAVTQYFGIRWGFRLVVSWVVFSCLFLFLAICAADATARRLASGPPAVRRKAPPPDAKDRTFSLVRQWDGSLGVSRSGTPPMVSRSGSPLRESRGGTPPGVSRSATPPMVSRSATPPRPPPRGNGRAAAAELSIKTPGPADML